MLTIIWIILIGDYENKKPIHILLPIIEEKSFADFQYTQNIPIPEDIKKKNEEIRLEKEKLKQEEEKKELELAKQKEKPKTTSRSSENRTVAEDSYLKFTATGYCPCEKCCGVADGLTASGEYAKANHTVAMPKSYPFGTKIEIKGYGTYIVEDRGGAIKGNKIDIFFNTHQEALNFGKKTVYLKVVD